MSMPPATILFQFPIGFSLASITSGDVCFYSRKDRSYVSCIEYEGYGDDSMLITYIIQSLPEIIRYLNEVAREREERAKRENPIGN